MSALVLVATLSSAFAGYGDVVEGFPNAGERALHLWTNAARVDPLAFEGFYDCPTANWQAYEQTAQAPISMDYDLVEAARFHSQDMHDNNHFAHESSDGTSFAARMGRFYDSGFIGENIAYGYYDEFDAVFEGWMCSDGHRANIMLPEWVELGTGVVANYYTQDFGGGAADTDGAVVMGTHWPLDALSSVEFLSDWHDTAAPARMLVVVDGRAEPMALEYGAADMGIYAAEVSHSNAGCHAYYFAWETEDGASGTFPATGSYLYGEGCAEAHGDAASADGFVATQQGSDAVPGGGTETDGTGSTVAGEGGTSFSDDDIFLVGCATAPLGATGALALFSLGLAVSRRQD